AEIRWQAAVGPSRAEMWLMAGKPTDDTGQVRHHSQPPLAHAQEEARPRMNHRDLSRRTIQLTPLPFSVTPWLGQSPGTSHHRCLPPPLRLDEDRPACAGPRRHTPYDPALVQNWAARHRKQPPPQLAPSWQQALRNQHGHYPLCGMLAATKKYGC